MSSMRRQLLGEELDGVDGILLSEIAELVAAGGAGGDEDGVGVVG